MITVKNLSRYYQDFCAIEDISFSIVEHEIIGFLGLNGAGKSTTLKILAGLLPPSSGEVYIDSVNWLEEPEKARQHIGFLPEEPPLYRDMTVYEFLRYVGKLRNYPSKDIDARMDMVLDMCQLHDRKHQVIQELSLGYKKRVGIAQAIIHKPKLVILDEPTSGLDPQQMVELRKVIRSLSKEATVLLSSHNLHEISETCDRLIILHKGKLLAEGNQSSLANSLQKDNNTVECIVDAKDFSKKIQTIPSILTHSIQHEHSETLEINITSSDPVPVLVRKLVEAQINIHHITPASSELEKIFLSLTTV